LNPDFGGSNKMAHKYLGWVAVGCLISAVFFLVWTVSDHRQTQALVWLCIAFYGLAFVLGFAYGCQEIVRTTVSWIGRGLQAVFLLGSMAIVAICVAVVLAFFSGIVGVSP